MRFRSLLRCHSSVICEGAAAPETPSCRGDGGVTRGCFTQNHHCSARFERSAKLSSALDDVEEHLKSLSGDGLSPDAPPEVDAAGRRASGSSNGGQSAQRKASRQLAKGIAPELMALRCESASASTKLAFRCGQPLRLCAPTGRATLPVDMTRRPRTHRLAACPGRAASLLSPPVTTRMGSLAENKSGPSGRQFVVVNYTAVVKGVKKWNKNVKTGRRLDATSVLLSETFFTSRALSLLVRHAASLHSFVPSIAQPPLPLALRRPAPPSSPFLLPSRHPSPSPLRDVLLTKPSPPPRVSFALSHR